MSDFHSYCENHLIKVFQYKYIQKQDQTLLWTCVAFAHLQCVNNHNAKFEYKGMKSVSITDYTQINNVNTTKVV